MSVGIEKDVSKAIYYLEKAKHGEHYEAASILAHIYLTEARFINKSEGYKNLDYASRDPKNMNAKLMLISYYFENSFKLISPFICNKITDLFQELLQINEAEEWYSFAHRVFYSHDFSLKYPSNDTILCKTNSKIKYYREY